MIDSRPPVPESDPADRRGPRAGEAGPIRLEVAPPDPDTVQRAWCRHRRRCLGVAAAGNWKAWSCGAGACYEQLTGDELKLELETLAHAGVMLLVVIEHGVGLAGRPLEKAASTGDYAGIPEPVESRSRVGETQSGQPEPR